MVYHTIAWLIWLSAAALLAITNHQPLVSLVLILATGSTFTVAGQHNTLRQNWATFLRLGLWVWLVALVFNLFSTHAGRIVLATLPRHWPLIGGPITLEALLYGLANGANLFAMLLVFATFNLVVDVHRLLRWVPAALYQAGLVVSIALAFVPQMMASLRDIREAQRVRGHRFKGLRDLLPLLVPLITTALERSLTLAESMEARGFGSTAEEQARSPAPYGHARLRKDGHKGQRYRMGIGTRAVASHKYTSVVMIGGLLLLLAGLLWQAVKPQTRWLGPVFLGLGVIAVITALYIQGRWGHRTYYRHELWRPHDTWVCLASVASILLIFYVKFVHPLALWYYPYPPSSPWPTFFPALGLAAALLAVPAFLWPAEAHDTSQSCCERL